MGGRGGEGAFRKPAKGGGGGKREGVYTLKFKQVLSRPVVL